jgi:hypothetical protein
MAASKSRTQDNTPAGVKKPTLRAMGAASGVSAARMQAGRRAGDADKNIAPSQWGRRLARLVGDKFGVHMSENMSKNEGTYRGRDIVIKCAKSPMPPVSVLIDMVDRIDELWAVYVMPEGGAEVWVVDAKEVREQGYHTHGPNVQKRIEIYLRKIVQIGKLKGTLTEDEVESCHIP